MPYDNIISRSDVQALIPEEVSDVMLTNLANESAALSMFRRIPMATNQTRFPVLSALPVAYFVNGDTGLKQTTEIAWENKYMNVEELAAIVPIPEAVLDDTSFDVWEAVRPLLEQAIARALDAAIFFGTNKPSSWPDAIVPAALAAGNSVVIGTATAAEGGIAEDINQLFATLEADGYNPTGVIASTQMRATVRSLRDTTGGRLLDVTPTQWWDVTDIRYPMRGLWPTAVSTVRAITGDYDMSLLGVRKDFTYKVLDQAAIFDNAGGLVFNLPQQDMVALRIVFRVAWQVANPINYDQQTEASRYPFATLIAAA